MWRSPPEPMESISGRRICRSKPRARLHPNSGSGTPPTIWRRRSPRGEPGPSYINIGPIYPTRTKSVSCGALGVEAIRRIAPQVNLPFSVMGGIKAAQIPELLAAGARHIAMVTEVTQAPDVAAKVRELRALFRN